MGWDTQINIIVESITYEEKIIASELYEKDAKSYFHNGISFAKFKHLENNSKVLFYTYKRRKYLPYWIIQDISSKFKNKYFSVIGSCPDFIGGPAGLIKVFNGEIIDSYGFLGERQNISRNPNPELLFQWFGKDKYEENYRETYIDNHPKLWVDELYSENIIDFSKEQMDTLKDLVQRSNLNIEDWNEILIK